MYEILAFTLWLICTILNYNIINFILFAVDLRKVTRIDSLSAHNEIFKNEHTSPPAQKEDQSRMKYSNPCMYISVTYVGWKGKYVTLQTLPILVIE